MMRVTLGYGTAVHNVQPQDDDRVRTMTKSK